MTYMEMLPIVAELSTTWDWHDAAGRTPAEKATVVPKIEGLIARLPPKETVPFWGLLETAARGYAVLMPAVRRVRELEAEETKLLDQQEELRKISAVKWGPKKLPSGETATSLDQKLTAARKEMDGLMDRVKAVDDRISPFLDQLKSLDTANRNKADVDAWAARGYTGPTPACVVERSRLDAEEFLAGSVALPMPGRRGRKV